MLRHPGKTIQNRKTAIALTTVLAILSVLASCIVFAFLPVSPERFTVTSVCFVLGMTCSFALYQVATRLPNKRWIRVTLATLFVLCASTPIISAIVPRITYSRFGFTVFGVTPIPFLDITINRNGILWFRSKTHQITRAELDALISPRVDVVIVGIGWDSIAQLTDDAKRLGDTLELHVLSTPEAFSLYKKLKSEGRSVVLLAHSTC